MSIIFQHLVRDTDGVLPVTLTNPSPASIGSQGLMVNANGEVHAQYIDVLPIDHYYYGLPYNSEGGLVLSGEELDYFDQSIPIAIDGAIAVSTSPVSEFINQGIDFSISGRIVIDTGVAPMNPPDQVTNVVVTVPNLNALNVTWDTPAAGDAPINGYLFEYKLASSGIWQNVVLGVVNNYEQAGLIAGETYDIRISASNLYGFGPWSTTVQGVPEELPAAPANLVLTPDIDEINAAWDAVTSFPAVTSYTIEYKESSSGVWTTASAGLSLTIDILSLTAGTQYDVRVKAINARGDGPYSTIEQAIPTELPFQVTGLGLTAGNGQILAFWDSQSPFPAVTDYTVEWKLAAAGVWDTQTTGTTTNYLITGLTNGSLYDVRVKATNAAGDGPYSVTEQETPFVPPSVLVLHYDENGVGMSNPLTFWNNTGTLAGQYDYTVPTSSNMFTATRNGFACGQSNGAARLACVNQGAAIPQPYTMYISGRNFVVDFNGRYWFEGVGGNESFRHDNANTWAFSNPTALFGGVAGDFNAAVYAIVFDGANSRIIGQGAALSFDVSGPMGTADYNPQSLFWNNAETPNQFFQGVLYEKRVYTGAHDTTTLNATIAAIRSKYGF